MTAHRLEFARDLVFGNGRQGRDSWVQHMRSTLCSPLASLIGISGCFGVEICPASIRLAERLPRIAFSTSRNSRAIGFIIC
jgi:hypothetical protein